MSLEEILMGGAPALGAPLSPERAAAFRTYYELLEEANSRFNLTAISGEEDCARLHFLDSLALCGIADLGGRSLLDVGTGAGFPGLPVALCVPDCRVTLVDATEKKVEFLRQVSERLGLDTHCVHGRAEELGQDPAYRESFDICTSRAVARLNVLCELCLPMVRPGGLFIALKAKDSDAEIDEARSAAKKLGGGEIQVREYPIPGTEIVRRAVIIKKTGLTAAKYPRRYATIKKSPL